MSKRAPLLPLVLLAACGGGPPPAVPGEPPPAEPAPVTAPAEPTPPPASAEPEPAPPPPPRKAVATLEARSRSKLTGAATLVEEGGGVRVKLEVAGVARGRHGAHVHELGDCSAPDAASAGAHFNPGGHPHGLPEVPARHLGDLGNVEVGADGKGTLEILVAGATLDPDAAESYVGRAIIVHEKADDGGQPAGNAGGRIGCGVVRAE